MMVAASADHWMPPVLDENDLSTSDIPLVTWFSEGNGGKFRLSYHGFPWGCGQLVESPDTFHIDPMQIHMPGPLLSGSKIPPTTGHSGLIECPCSDRLPKNWSMSHALQSPNSCASSTNLGYEIDQVRVTPSGDVPVPITWAYQHHYGVFLLNAKKAKLVKVKAS